MADIFDEIRGTGQNQGGDIFDQVRGSGRGPSAAAHDTSNDLYDLATNPQRAFELMTMLGNAPVSPPPDPGIWEGFIHSTLKAVPRVALATAGSLATMPFAGVAGLSELAATGDVTKAGRTIREVSALPSRVLNLTPEEQQGAENIGLAMKPLEMAGSGWKGIAELASTGDIQQAADVVQGKSGGSNIAVPIAGAMGEAAALFSFPKLPKLIKDSAFYRTMTIPERGLALQSLNDAMKANPGMTEGQILRKWNNPTWQEEALGKRAVEPTGDIFYQVGAGVGETTSPGPVRGALPEPVNPLMTRGPNVGEIVGDNPRFPLVPSTAIRLPEGPIPPGPAPPEIMGRPGRIGPPPSEIFPTAGEARPPAPAVSPEPVLPNQRVDLKTRKRIDELTPEEMKQELLTDHLTGMPNKRAYIESSKGEVQAAIDVDSLKWVNDNFGHQAGDELLQKVGKALDSQVNKGLTDSSAYHISGDEFVVHGKDPVAIKQQLAALEDVLKN
jgi:hypothetical protein